MRDKEVTRRQFLGQLAAVPAGVAVLQSAAMAEELPRVDEADPAAKALLYVHDVANVDTANPMAARFEASQNCANCLQIQGNEGDTWRPCAIFPGKSVNVNGWCSAWIAKP